MSASEALALRSAFQTLVITRGLVPARAAHMRQTGGAELRSALDVHISGDAASAHALCAFWIASGGQPISVVQIPMLVSAVAGAVEAGRLRAYVFREPAYISKVDFRSLQGQAELAVRRPPPPGPRGGTCALPFADMDVADRFVEVFRRTIPRVGPQMGQRLRELVENPAQLALMVGTIVILAQLHAVAAGEVIDGVVLSAIIACAMLEGMSALDAMITALDAVVRVVDFIMTTVGAQDEKDLDRAADKLAESLSLLSVGLLAAMFERIAGRLTSSQKKAGPQRQIETVSKEEVAAKGKKAAPEAPKENASPPPVQSNPPAEKTAPETSRALQPYWPPNRGFQGTPVTQELPVGTRIDRYGYEGGTFLSPEGTPPEMRSLAPGTTSKPYTVYEVTKPLEVQAGKAAPWFGQIGQGIQYELPMSVRDALGEYLKKVDP